MEARRVVPGLVDRGVRFFTDLLVPDACQLCGKRHQPQAPPDGVAACLHGEIEVPLIGPLCVRNHPFCARCLSKLVAAVSPAGALDGVPVIAPFKTDATLLAIAHRIKFSRFRSLCRPLASAMADAWANCGMSLSALVPVPMDARSLARRGFNPAELLARYVGSRVDVPVVTDALNKPRRTMPQSLTPHQRRPGNVEGAFRATGRLEGMRVVVVDDLVTTGATARACMAEISRVGGIPDAVLCAGVAL